MSNANRSGPADGGYMFSQKELYRRRIWNVAKRESPNRNCLLMPSIEGLEIDTALAKGFPESGMHIVDDNPAIVATLKRSWPKLTTYGVDVARACERIGKARGMVLGFANLDFCSWLSRPQISKLVQIATSGCWADEAVIAVTMLRGREALEESFLIDLVAAGVSVAQKGGCAFTTGIGHHALQLRDHARIDLAATALVARPQPLKAGVYWSPKARQTFLWAVFRRISYQHFLSPQGFTRIQSKLTGLYDGMRVSAQYASCDTNGRLRIREALARRVQA